MFCQVYSFEMPEMMQVSTLAINRYPLISNRGGKLVNKSSRSIVFEPTRKGRVSLNRLQIASLLPTLLYLWGNVSSCPSGSSNKFSCMIFLFLMAKNNKNFLNFEAIKTLWNHLRLMTKGGQQLGAESNERGEGGLECFLNLFTDPLPQEQPLPKGFYRSVYRLYIY